MPFSLSKGRAPERGLLVTVSSADQASQWARLAQEKGCNRLLLKVYSDADGATVKEWVAAAKAAAPMVEVYLQVAVLRTNPATKEGIPAGNLERNQLGETSVELAQRYLVEEKRRAQKATREHLATPTKVNTSGSWEEDTQKGELLSPMVPEVTTGLASHIADIVRTSGASGVILTDLTLPGTGRYVAYTNDEYRDNPGRNFGYTPSARLAFLRETGTDPIDFSFSGGDYLMGNGNGYSFRINLALPFFPVSQAVPQNPSDSRSQWLDFQKKQMTQLRQEVITALQGAGVTHAFLENDTQPVNLDISVADLDKLAGLPKERLPGTWDMDQKKVTYLYPFRFRDVPVSLRPTGMSVSERFARLAFGQLGAYMTFTKPGEPVDPTMLHETGGFLMDLTGQTPDAGKELLQNIVVGP